MQTIRFTQEFLLVKFSRGSETGKLKLGNIHASPTSTSTHPQPKHLTVPSCGIRTDKLKWVQIRRALRSAALHENPVQFRTWT